MAGVLGAGPNLGSPGAGPIFGELDNIASTAKGLQAISDAQNAIMQHVASIAQGLAVSLQGAAGRAAQQVSEHIQTIGNQHSARFADHADKMANNGRVMDDADQAHAQQILSQVSTLT